MRINKLAEIYGLSPSTTFPSVGWSSTEAYELGVAPEAWAAGPIHSASRREMDGDAGRIGIAVEVSPVSAHYHMLVLIFSNEARLMTRLALNNCAGSSGYQEIDVSMRGIPLDVKIRLLLRKASAEESNKAFVSRAYVAVLT